MTRRVRSPVHAGSWYDGDGHALSSSIEQWMEDVSPSGRHATAIIGPHAGYRYCGHVMAYAYRHLDPSRVSRVFILGPSHHYFTRRCALSPATVYSTPLGDLAIDEAVVDDLRSTGMFETMSLDVDEAEHSLELHLPYICAVMRGKTFTIVPIMVGSISLESEAKYGRLLAPYLDDPQNAFVVSTDFCHWGTRFNFTFHDASHGPIYKSIEWLDKNGMDIIEQVDPQGFHQYLQECGNTICGRHPVSVLLFMLQHARRQLEFKKYDQSSQCQSLQDSSVSYAAAVVTAAA